MHDQQNVKIIRIFQPRYKKKNIRPDVCIVPELFNFM